jgi:hypothetical protein
MNGVADSNQSTASGADSPSRQRSWVDDRHSELMEEPKEDSWAYFMEQAMLQFLANHPAMPEFTLEYIECRSITCQIRVAGYDESTGPTWQRVIYDMRQQPWYEFGQVGSSSAEVEGRFMTITELHRLLPE